MLDRLVGYSLSPLLWDKVQRGLSAGRVQSVAVRLIVDREREIEAFVPDEYWSLHARLSAKLPPEFVATLREVDAARRPRSRPRTATQARGRRGSTARAGSCAVGHPRRAPPESGAAVHHVDPAAGRRPQARLLGRRRR